MGTESEGKVEAARQELLSLIRAESDWPDCEATAQKLAHALLERTPRHPSSFVNCAIAA